MRVDEGEGRGEVAVVADYVAEVGHCFVAFVHGGCEVGGRGGRGWVDRVYCGLPARIAIVC